ncbi:hypothetical protein DSCW_53630 [Desulfosarcina widdelii]|uniref:Uncharacterized protein n=1 Tax=Desulfosarcina widdelii TaxID=947919 RepID=A0A5K7Z800_9BACT|nr:hypothetical protein DSCW_53630 [Desulfosarcina widdelii]
MGMGRGQSDFFKALIGLRCEKGRAVCVKDFRFQKICGGCDRIEIGIEIEGKATHSIPIPIISVLSFDEIPKNRI